MARAIHILAVAIAVLTGRDGLADESSQRLRQATNGTPAFARLTELCDRFGARFSGTTNLEAAIDWTVARLREDGFDEVR
ncbi:MAG: hypothetical protein ACKVYV_10295, partial [Limisphaerales bacterium]